MEQVIIHPAPLHGAVNPPPSKSAAHRAVICAALSQGVSRLTPVAHSDDIDATVGVMRGLGATIHADESGLTVDGTNTLHIESGVFDCHESGSTLRFLIPVAAVAGGRCTFTGSGRLPQRPLGPYLSCLPQNGVTCETLGGLPLTLSGKLQSGDFSLPGNVSSQFITGLLLALPMLGGDSRVLLTTPLESSGYIDLTTGMMARFGVSIEKTEEGYFVPGGQTYRPCDIAIEGDWSQAAFWLVAGALGGAVACKGLDPDTKQGDRFIVSLLRHFGATVAVSADNAQAHASSLHGIEIDASQIPDLVPVLAAAASFADGHTVIKNAARLRIKESDRLHTITVGLQSLGAKITETQDGLIIDGGRLSGGTADSAGDHRIAMALSVAAAYCTEKSVIGHCECIAKSYPAFFRDFNLLGGHADVIHMG